MHRAHVSARAGASNDSDSGDNASNHDPQQLPKVVPKRKFKELYKVSLKLNNLQDSKFALWYPTRFEATLIPGSNPQAKFESFALFQFECGIPYCGFTCRRHEAMEEHAERKHECQHCGKRFLRLKLHFCPQHGQRGKCDSYILSLHDT